MGVHFVHVNAHLRSRKTLFKNRYRALPTMTIQTMDPATTIMRSRAKLFSNTIITTTSMMVNKMYSANCGVVHTVFLLSSDGYYLLMNITKNFNSKTLFVITCV